MNESLNSAEKMRLLSEVGFTGPETDAFLACFKTLDHFAEEEAAWLIPGWVPEGQITLMAADGGVGKTTIWSDIIAALSSGRSCLLDPPGHQRPPMRVAFMTTEDSVRKKLKKQLRLAGARLENVLTPDFLSDKNGQLHDMKLGSEKMARFIRHFRPALCVFDPVQGFIPPDINMGSRNAMRDCMAPLVSLGEECGTSFLVVCHTNKRKAAAGRERISDSADLWDVSRSVLMAGYAEAQGLRYLSNEKNNYAPLQETVLFSIADRAKITREGTSWKRDRDFMQAQFEAKSAPKREDCKAFVLAALEEAGGSMPSASLEKMAAEEGYSFATLKRAKDALKAEGSIQYCSTGNSKKGGKIWHVALLSDASPAELDADAPVPF